MMQIDELVNLAQLLREKLEELDTLDDCVHCEEETKPLATATVNLLRSYADYIERWDDPNVSTLSDQTDEADEGLTKAIGVFEEAVSEEDNE